MLDRLRGVVNNLATQTTAVKVVLIVVGFALLILLSRALVVLATLLLFVSLFALVARLLRRRALKGWGIAALVSLVSIFALTSIANAVYGPLGPPTQQQATSETAAEEQGASKGTEEEAVEEAASSEETEEEPDEEEVQTSEPESLPPELEPDPKWQPPPLEEATIYVAGPKGGPFYLTWSDSRGTIEDSASGVIGAEPVEYKVDLSEIDPSPNSLQIDVSKDGAWKGTLFAAVKVNDTFLECSHTDETVGPGFFKDEDAKIYMRNIGLDDPDQWSSWTDLACQRRLWFY